MGDQSLFSGENAAFLDTQYVAWLADPASVDPRWSKLFEGWGRPDDGRSPAEPAFKPKSIFASGPAAAPARDDAGLGAARRQAKVAQLINAFRVRGHIVAAIDPLGVWHRGDPAELLPAFFDLHEDELDEPCDKGPLYGEPQTTTPRRVLARLNTAYCARVGIEYMNIHDITQRHWVQDRVETIGDRPHLDKPAAAHFLRKVSDAENFERMLQQRFPGTKRFSIEGGEPLIALLDIALEEAGRLGVLEVALGMSHRGRLNVLANIMDKPMNQIVGEFQDQTGESFQGSGDVKYHLGYSSDYMTRGGHAMHVSLTPNPSHLETVNAVVEGRARAKQDRIGDHDGKKVMPVLLHGDAAFIGQGLVAETLNMSGLEGYKTGGTLHIIVNNQIGFTTSPRDSRSGQYPTDIARMLAIPIFHVNGEDPEAIAAIMKIAMEWRHTFGRDVVIDFCCYRKFGHNEGDEPGFTQPVMYDAIRHRDSPRQVIAQRLIERKLVTEADVQRINEESMRAIEDEATHGAPPPSDDLAPNKALWKQYVRGAQGEPDTVVPLEQLQGLMRKANVVPDGFNLHPKLVRLLAQRLEMVEGARPLDWAMGEQAAFATLAPEGFRVRLSGQDVGRGTFSQRHAVLTDTKTSVEYLPLQHLTADQAPVNVYDSPLSEYAVLGFDFGYSWDYPDALVLWEAQFGDFVNGAQIILDQYVVAGEQKWNRHSGLVILLPHGYEGQGPEHSSARPERFLQLCGEQNIQVACPTTPANLYHLLRRQCLRDLRKPLVILEPKSLLRHPEATSSIADLATGGFQHVIPDTIAPTNVKRVVLCTGKVYFDLLKARRERDLDHVALVRVEMLYPFPAEQILAAIAPYGHPELVWCQEEPRNMGAWPMYDEWLRDELPGFEVRYAGRKSAASPATGSHHKHEAEQAALVDDALTP